MSLPADKNRRLRVLVLMKTTAMGGAERVVINALPHIDRETFDYQFAALDDGGPLAVACRDAGFLFTALPYAGGVDPRTIWALRSLLRRRSIDLVHAHLPIPGFFARVAARGLDTRVVYTEHTTQDVYRRPSRWLNAVSYGWQDAVLAVSSRVRDSAAALGRNGEIDFSVVPNGVDLEQIDREAAQGPRAPLPPRTPGHPLLLVPANLTRVKGQDVLLDALAQRSARGAQSVDVWFAGEGPCRAALEAQARRSGGSRVHFLGQRDDVFALMRLADAVVLPSRREGLPLALLEARVLGRPIVATAVGGVPEILSDGTSGLLVPPEDAGALARALDQILDARDRDGAAAAAEARTKFDVRHAVRRVEGVYRRALAREGPQAAARASVT